LSTNFEKVHEFHRAFGILTKDKAELADEKMEELRFSLIEEEFIELIEALSLKDIVGVADALTDMLYVIYGMGHVYGIDLDACFEEVHKSNMTKFGDDGKPIHRNDGKVVKGPNYRPPELRPILKIESDNATST